MLTSQMPVAADISECIHVLQRIKDRSVAQIQLVADLCRKAIATGNTIYFMGNGGSAADSQHLAAELVGRFEKVRKNLPAVALTLRQTHRFSLLSETTLASRLARF